MMMAVASGHDSLPSPVPTGTDYYYQERLADFEVRCPGAKAPSYYADFGDKCLHQFRRTEPHLTVRGQRWLQTTLVDLQERMEQRRAVDPAAFSLLELDDEAFERMAFEMHSDSYLDSGLSALPVSDLVKIAKTPDIADLVTPAGLKEVFKVISELTTARKRSGPLRGLSVILQRLKRLLVGRS